MEAQQLVLAAWALVAATLLGLGLLERRLFGPALAGTRDLWLAFWMGWAVLVAGLQVWHLFLPVDNRARIAFVALGLLGWLVSAAPPWRVPVRSLRRGLPALVAVMACAWWLSNRAMAGPTFGDTGLYLVPAVHWIESFPIVPGLANLYVPLGHNVSYFLYAAFVDAGPFAGRFFHIVNSTLVLALLARGVFACSRLLRRDASGVAGDMFYALALVPLFDLAFGIYLGSPMPDTAVFLFGLVLAGELIEFAAAPSRAFLLRLVFLAAAALTIKLSLAVLALATAAVAMFLWLWRSSPSVGDAARIAALGALVGLVPAGPWLLRSVVMSGLPFYPAQVLAFPVDWIARVDATAWVQKPMALAPLYTIFTDWAWWSTRLDSLGWYEPDATRPLAMMAIGLAVFVVAKPIHWWRGRPSAVPTLVLAVPVASFFFAFLNTPMPRYQGATLWIIAIDLIVIGLATAGGQGRLVRAAAVVLSVVGAALPFHYSGEPWLPLTDFEITTSPRVHDNELASGLVVAMPENQVCWYASLPCSPEIHPGLRLREPGNLARGFAIDP
ncbi:MAG: hypothetical protein ABR587_13165 [Candidatus Binatia bacterium]